MKIIKQCVFACLYLTSHIALSHPDKKYVTLEQFTKAIEELKNPKQLIPHIEKPHIENQYKNIKITYSKSKKFLQFCALLSIYEYTKSIIDEKGPQDFTQLPRTSIPAIAKNIQKSALNLIKTFENTSNSLGYKFHVYVEQLEKEHLAQQKHKETEPSNETKTTEESNTTLNVSDITLEESDKKN